MLKAKIKNKELYIIREFELWNPYEITVPMSAFDDLKSILFAHLSNTHLNTKRDGTTYTLNSYAEIINNTLNSYVEIVNTSRIILDISEIKWLLSVENKLHADWIECSFIPPLSSLHRTLYVKACISTHKSAQLKNNKMSNK